MILRNAGVNTNIGFALRPRKDTPVNFYLDNKWTPSVGKSPKSIGLLLGVSTATVVAALRNRRDSLAVKIEHLPLKDYEDGVAYALDPYMMTAVLSVSSKKGEEYELLLTEKEIIMRLRESQYSES